jgi:hypothetical protein
MSDDITLSEIQEFIAGFWYHYDQGHFDELATRIGDEMEYLSRSDSGHCPFEDLLAAELHGTRTPTRCAITRPTSSVPVAMVP